MSADDLEVVAEQFDGLLAACDEAMAAGATPSLADSAAAPPEVRAQLERGLACMKMLRDLLPLTAPLSPTAATAPVSPSSSLGRFQIRRELGRGSFGVVFLAYDPQLRREIALKVPRPDVLASAEMRERFLREARVAAVLDHPNVVPVYEAGEVGTVCYIVAAYCPGSTLAQWLKQHDEPVLWREAAALVATLADAVQHAHSRGVQHRDLKPANILLQRKTTTDSTDDTDKQIPHLSSSVVPVPSVVVFVPRIADFGLARFLEDEEGPGRTQSGAVVGTPSYMAPEQASGRSRGVGPAADVYALGSILYELLTGRPPFRGESVLDTLEQVRSLEPVPPGHLRAKLPRDLETICLHCLVKEPVRRYVSAAALADDLRRYLSGEPIHARPVGAGERAVKWVQRRPVPAALVALLIVVVNASVLGLLGLWLRAEAQRDEASRATTEAERQRDEARVNWYAAQVHLAQRAYDDGLLGQTLELLEGLRPREKDRDLRGFEWYYLRCGCHGERLTLRGHTAPITGVAFSPDGNSLATASLDGTLKIWNADYGNEVSTFALEAQVTCLAYSPEGRYLATASANYDWVRILDATRSISLIELPGHAAPIKCLAFSGDGQRLASASADDTIRIWGVDTNRAIGWHLLSVQATGVESIALSPDGQYLAANGRKASTKVWELPAVPVEGASPRLILESNNREARGVAFSPDSRCVAASQFFSVICWDLATGRELRSYTIVPGTFAFSMAFSPDGKWFAAGCSDGTVTVSDAAKGGVTTFLRGHTGPITSVTFSSDGKRLASASEDATVRVWDMPLVQKRSSVFSWFPGYTVAFSPDGQSLATGTEREVRIWDLATTEEIRCLGKHADQVGGVAYSPDGRYLASTAGQEVKVWDPGSGQELLTFKGHTDRVLAVAFSPDGDRLASAGAEGTVQIWAAATGQLLLALQVEKKWVTAVAFSPDGERLASAGFDGTVKLWDPVTGQELFSLRADAAQVWSVAFSPDSRRIASAGADGSVKVWDVATAPETDAKSPVRTLRGYGGRIDGVTFSPDGRRLASASAAGSLIVWDVASGQELLRFKGLGGFTGAAFSPDGQYLAGAGTHGTSVRAAVQLAPEVLLQREAYTLVESLFAERVRKPDVLDRLRTDPTLRASVRTRALAQAERYVQHPDDLNATSWAVARQNDRSADQYRRALLEVETACQLVPDNGIYLTTLGAVQYRLLRYPAALETLRRSSALNTARPEEPQPYNLALLAMTQHCLGFHEQAGACWERLQEALKQPRWTSDGTAQALQREAALLLGRVQP